MKKIALAPLFFFTAVPLLAVNTDALRTYVIRALAKCPDQKITIQPIDQPGPFGFFPFTVAQTSSDTTCGREAIALYSPSTNQVLIGSVFALPVDNRSLEMRVTETASRLLKQNISANITAFPLLDGLRPISLTKGTQWGPFSYHGFVDSAGRFLIVGSRGNLSVPPATTLVENLGIERAVRRGNPKSSVKIIELSDFECPTCAKAHKTVE